MGGSIGGIFKDIMGFVKPLMGVMSFAFPEIMPAMAALDALQNMNKSVEQANNKTAGTGIRAFDTAHKAAGLAGILGQGANSFNSSGNGASALASALSLL